jgi:hypothetical protein
LLREAGIACSPWGWHFLASTAPVALTVAPDVGGLVVADPALTILADGELFGRRARRRRVDDARR